MKRKKLKKKDNAQVNHFKNRFFERCNVEIFDHDIQYLRGKINKGKYSYRLKQSNRVYIYDIDFKDISCFIVYDEKRKKPITVLTKDMTSLKKLKQNVNNLYRINKMK